MIRDKQEKQSKNLIILGILLIILGSFFLLRKMGFFNFDFGKIWPFALIILGILLVAFNSKKSLSKH